MITGGWLVRPNETEHGSQPVDGLDNLLDERRVLRVAGRDLACRHLNLRKQPFCSGQIHENLLST